MQSSALFRGQCFSCLLGAMTDMATADHKGMLGRLSRNIGADHWKGIHAGPASCMHGIPSADCHVQADLP